MLLPKDLLRNVLLAGYDGGIVSQDLLWNALLGSAVLRSGVFCWPFLSNNIVTIFVQHYLEGMRAVKHQTCRL